MDDLKEDYNQTASSFAKSRDRMWPELKFLFDYAKEGEEVLDLGCGNGRFSRYLVGCKYTGLDFSKELIKEAKKRFPEHSFVVGDALDIPFEDNTFDKVYSIAVVHQIPSTALREKAVREIKRVLKENGEAFVTVWDVNSLDKPVKYFSQEGDEGIIGYFTKIIKGRDFYLKRNRYYYAFKEKELGFLFKKEGFKVSEEGVAREDKRSNFYVIVKKEKNTIIG